MADSIRGNLHILHVAKRYPKAVGGDATVVLGLEREQRNNGHRVTVVTSNCSSINDGPYIHKFGLQISEAALDRINLRRILLVPLGAVWGLRLLWCRPFPDVVHAHALPDLGASLALPARLLGIPRVLTLPGTCIGNPMFGRKSWLERILVRIGRYDRLFTVDPQLFHFFKASPAHRRYSFPMVLHLESSPSGGRQRRARACCSSDVWKR